jgi:alpha-glucosidase (family GH31 glycosyl hydrolase)
LKEAGSLFRDPHTEQSAVARLWIAGGGESCEGGHIDFTSPKGFKWWFDGVSELRKTGIDAIWNDNNEICIPDDDW